jgi:hypothetical protein
MDTQILFSHTPVQRIEPGTDVENQAEQGALEGGLRA